MVNTPFFIDGGNRIVLSPSLVLYRHLYPVLERLDFDVTANCMLIAAVSSVLLLHTAV
jgi:hypothetical protein